MSHIGNLLQMRLSEIDTQILNAYLSCQNFDMNCRAYMPATAECPELRPFCNGLFNTRHPQPFGPISVIKPALDLLQTLDTVVTLEAFTAATYAVALDEPELLEQGLEYGKPRPVISSIIEQGDIYLENIRKIFGAIILSAKTIAEEQGEEDPGRMVMHLSGIDAVIRGLYPERAKGEGFFKAIDDLDFGMYERFSEIAGILASDVNIPREKQGIIGKFPNEENLAVLRKRVDDYRGRQLGRIYEGKPSF